MQENFAAVKAHVHIIEHMQARGNMQRRTYETKWWKHAERCYSPKSKDLLDKAVV